MRQPVAARRHASDGQTVASSWCPARPARRRRPTPSPASPAAARTVGAARSGRARAAPPCARATRSPCSRPSGRRGAPRPASTIIASRSHLASTLAAATRRARPVGLDPHVHARRRHRRRVVGGSKRSRLRRAAEPVVRAVEQHDVDRADGRGDRGQRARAREPQGGDDADLVDLGGARVARPHARGPSGAARAAARVRAAGARSLESATPSGADRVVTSTTTTPTLTGPASEPRPTSSIPASSRAPSRRSSALVAQVRCACGAASGGARRVAASRCVTAGRARPRTCWSGCAGGRRARAATPSRTPCRRRSRSGTEPPPGLPVVVARVRRVLTGCRP